MKRVEVRSQAEFEAAIEAGHWAVVLRCRIKVSTDVEFEAGDGATIVARESSAPRVVAWGSSAPCVVAQESSAPRVVAQESSAPCVEAWESSAPRVVAWGSSAPRVVAWGSSAPRVEAWESSAPRVVAWGSSAPRVEARESSAPRVVARGSSAPCVEARESSTPRVEAWESSAPRVVAWGSSAPRVEAWGYTQIALSGFGAKIVAKLGRYVAALIQGDVQADGGQQTVVETPVSAEAWCEHYGVTITDGAAILYKGVTGDFRSGRGGDYTPGTVPVASDWDGGKAECGGGLHFSPHPLMTREFCNPARFVACQVAVADMRAPSESDEYPSKIKARGCCAPVWECDEDGNLIVGKPAEVE